jgi:NAD(P)H-hydrate epimerase
VTLAVPSTLHHLLEIKTTEAMTVPVTDNGAGFFMQESLSPLERALSGKNAAALGPGVSREPATAELMRTVIRKISVPTVLDADALNAVSEDCGCLAERVAPALVLTPHPGEMGRLTGLSAAEVEADRIGIARSFAQHHKVYLVLKGARTVIASPDGRVAVNGSGNPGMASGGMGDVLTGIVAALLAQGYDPFDACRLGVFVHGHAADLVAAEKGEIGITASDVVERLPYSFKTIGDYTC